MSDAEYPNPTASNASTSLLLTIEQGKELVRLCRTGRLYEVDAWIASGKSLSVPSELRKTPLQVAIDIGFHSLVRLLACHERDVANLNRALSDAVALRSLDAVNLLLEHGADLRSVPLADVLLSWEAERHAKATISRSLEQNSIHFNKAREKLEKWADDMVLSAEKALLDTKEQIKGHPPRHLINHPAQGRADTASAAPRIELRRLD